MAIWIKPNGIEIETVDTEETELLAARNGWKLKGAATEPEKPKRGRPKKTED